MSNTKIEWTDWSWNPITGCTPISEGCQHCYAKRMAQRFKGRFGYPSDDPFRVTFHPDRLELPLGMQKPKKIFVNSMFDFFHIKIKPRLQGAILGVIASCPQHIFQILTKRTSSLEYLIGLSEIDETPTLLRGWAEQTAFEIAQRKNQGLAAKDFHLGWPLQNLWLGVTVESAKHKDRIDKLRTIPAAVRFISFEPLLGDVGELDLTGIHWVIVGGETGPGARQMHSRWAYNIFDQCIQAKVSFFFKKWGSFYSDRQESIGQTFINGREWREFPQTR